jgi:hypothetical protein
MSIASMVNGPAPEISRELKRARVNSSRREITIGPTDVDGTPLFEADTERFACRYVADGSELKWHRP